jgi:phage baseplate assembly protein W
VSQQDRLGARFGVDLSFPGDFVPLASGDLERTRELEGLRANFARALITAPGEIFWRPDYGVGATEFLGRPANAVNASELKNRIRASLAGDERVESVDFVEAVFAPGGLEIEVRVTVAGSAQSLGIRITRA